MTFCEDRSLRRNESAGGPFWDRPASPYHSSRALLQRKNNISRGGDRRNHRLFHERSGGRPFRVIHSYDVQSVAVKLLKSIHAGRNFDMRHVQFLRSPVVLLTAVVV